MVGLPGKTDALGGDLSEWPRFEAAYRRYDELQERYRQATKQLLDEQTARDLLRRRLDLARGAHREANRQRLSRELVILRGSGDHHKARKLLTAAQKELEAAKGRKQSASALVAVEEAKRQVEERQKRLLEVNAQVLAEARGKHHSHLQELVRKVEAATRRQQAAEQRLDQAAERMAERRATRRKIAEESGAAEKKRQSAFMAITDPAERRRAAALMFRAMQNSGRPFVPAARAPLDRGVLSQGNRPDGRVCPVCDEGGLLPGQHRHKRCENATRAGIGHQAVQSRVVDVQATEVQGDVQNADVQAVDIDRVARYRALVALVEQREADTHGKRRASSDRPVRLKQSRKAVLLRCGGRCENPGCGGQPDDVTDAGEPLLVVDHVEDLGPGGRDHPELMAALCANCHDVKTRGREREALRAVLRTVAGREHQAWMPRL